MDSAEAESAESAEIVADGGLVSRLEDMEAALSARSKEVETLTSSLESLTSSNEELNTELNNVKGAFSMRVRVRVRVRVRGCVVVLWCCAGVCVLSVLG